MFKKLFCCMSENESMEEPIPYDEDEYFIEENREISKKKIYTTIDYNKNYHSKEECTICFDEFDNNKEMVLLPCLHYFHKDCIDSWWKKIKKQECPICRSSQ